jgi:putative ABC transport system permease protein
VFIITQATGGFSTGGAEGAVLSLSFYVFLGPFFAWIGLTLLVLRLVERGLSLFDKQLAEIYKKSFGDIGEVAGKSIARRAASVSAATTIIALTLSFGLSLALFQYTYSMEKRRDAQYVAGSDIRFTPSLNAPQTADFARQLILPGVTSVTGVMRDPQALVGSSNQTVYGIDVPSYRQAAYAPDRFYVDGAAQKTIDAISSQARNTAPGSYTPGTTDMVLGALEHTPNGVILAVDQAQKFNILVGDPVLLRLFNPNTRQYVDVKTVAVGMYLQSSTSSQDSDFILNRDFMAKAIGSDAMSFFLIKTNGQLGVVAQVTTALEARFKNAMPFHIDSVNTVVNVDASSLTALNLAGLGTMERIYTLLIVSVGLAIFLMAMINERRREFGAMRALGANLRHLRRFLFAEAGTIGVLSMIIGTMIGFGLARMLVLLLGAIFMTPTTALEVPWLELITLLALVTVGMIISTYISSRRLATLKVVEALREL